MANAWSKDRRPARQRYWDLHILEKRKIRAILANNMRVRNKDGTKGLVMTAVQVLRYWQAHRKGRVPDKYLPLALQYGTPSE